MIWQARNGELRIVEHGNSATTYYLEILFTEANLSGPIARPRTEEILYSDRGKADDHAGYREAPSISRLEPMPLTFSAKTADTDRSEAMSTWFSGATIVRGHTLYTRRGQGATYTTPIPQLGTWTAGLPNFADSGKIAFMVEVLWSKSGTSYLGYRWDEVYFPPNEQTITESEESVTLSLNGQVYGGVSKMFAFTTGCTEIGTG